MNESIRRPTISWALLNAERALGGKMSPEAYCRAMSEALSFYKHRYPHAAPANGLLYEFVAQTWIGSLRASQGKDTPREFRRQLRKWLPSLTRALEASRVRRHS